jgi:hypothetical protein
MQTNRLSVVTSLALFASVVISSCATSNTQLISSWRDPQIGHIQFKKVIAVAMVNNESRRRVIEERMVADIERYGRLAVPSYKLISTADTRNDEAVKAAMSAGGFDGAVAWRTVSVNNDTHWVPGAVGEVPVGYRGFYGYYHMGWETVYEPGYLQTDKIVRVETLVYALTHDSDRLVWTGTSQTFDPTSLDNLVDGVADSTIDAMRKEGLI